MFCGRKLRTLQISVNIPNEVSTPFNAVLNIPIFLTFFQNRNAQQPAKSPPSFHQHPKTFKNQGSRTFLALLCFKFLKITCQRPQPTPPCSPIKKNVVTSLSVGRSKFSYIQRLVYCWGSKSCWSDYLFFWRISFLVWALLKDVENPRN